MLIYFDFSMREKTKAHRRLVDDVSEEEKSRRNLLMHEVFRSISLQKKQGQVSLI